MKTYDAVVVGGGPIGAVVARCAAELGARVLLVDQRASVAAPIACTGLVSPRSLTVLGASTASVLREIHGVYAHAPGGRTLTLASEHVKALVIDRVLLEQELLDLAQSAGVMVLAKTRAIALADQSVHLQTPAGNRTVSTATVIGADGPESAVAGWAGLPSPGKRLTGMQAVLENAPAPNEFVSVFLGSHTAPGFFAWAVPAESGTLRVGLAVPSGINPALFLDRLIRERMPNAREISRIAGLIPIECVTQSTAGRVLLVGDAAGQVKPWSGGGLYTGGLCAQVAARFAADPAQGLEGYDEAWRQVIGTEMRFGITAHSMLASITDSEIDSVFEAVDHDDLLTFLADQADIDHPSHLVSALLSNRRLWKRIFSVAPTLLSLSAGQSSSNEERSVPSAKQKSLYSGPE